MHSRNAGDKNSAKAQRTLAAQNHLVYKLRAIRSLWVTAHNTPQSVEKMEREFMFLVGELIEGTPVEKLTMTNISRDSFLREFYDK